MGSETASKFINDFYIAVVFTEKLDFMSELLF